MYDEAVSGDLASYSSVDLGFSVGSNLVLGDGVFNDEGYDIDGFLFHLSAGQSLSDVIFTVTNRRVGTDESALSVKWSLIAGNYGAVTLSTSGNANILDSNEQVFFDDALPLGAGNYAFAPVSLSKSGSGGAWNYRIEFFVLDSNQIPEPESLALLGLGLAGLAFSRSKKKVA